MATCEKSQSETMNSHRTKKLRLRALSAEKDTFSSIININVAQIISVAQIIVGIIVCFCQIVTMTLVVGPNPYNDDMTITGGGLWSSSVMISAAILTLCSLKNPKYWKLHASFALHIISMVLALLIVLIQFGGNMNRIKRELGNALHKAGKQDFHYYSAESAKMLTVSLILNAVMTTGSLVQLVASFVMTGMTGRAICCKKSKGKLFEVEIAGSDTKDSPAIFRSQLKSTTGQSPSYPYAVSESA